MSLVMKPSRLVLLVALASCRNAPPSERVDHAPPPAAAASLAVPPLRAWSHEEVCGAQARQVRPKAGHAPFRRQGGGSCPGSFCDWVETAFSDDPCFVANANLRRAEAEIQKSPPRPPVSSPWDGMREPAWLDKVDAHLHLREGERRLLARNGFVVLDRAEAHSYVAAYHDIFQEQLPVFISVDSVLHSVFRSNGVLLEDLERHDLAPRLVRVLDRLRATLKSSTYSNELRHDLDVYLAVANALLHAQTAMSDEPARTSLFGADQEVNALVSAAASQGSGLAEVELFGRKRMIDFSQYAPRGHYSEARFESIPVGGERFVRILGYFQAMTWLQRLELNLVSRACRSSQPGTVPDPSETPREARLALALADLVERSGVAAELARFEEVYATFAGAREDVPLSVLADFLRRERLRPTDEASPARLRAALGDGHGRKARVHYMPELPAGAKLPVITSLFGSRVPPDVPGVADSLEAVKYERPYAHDLLGVLLGHARDRGKLPAEVLSLLDGAHATMAAGTGKDLYGRWLSAVLALGKPEQGVLPAFMKSPAYADLRLGSALVGYAQIRHNYVLLSAQGYDSYGCEIPDGFVEPAPEVYARLADYAASARVLGNVRGGQTVAYFSRVERVMRTLESISRKELRGEPLGDAEKRWLGMVAEYTPVGGYSDSGEPPKYTGWYFDLFPDREKGAEGSADFVADLGTSVQNGYVYSVGAEAPRLAVFVVDTGGAPRAFVGPVASGYERRDPIAARPSDESAWTSPHEPAAWGASHVAAAPAEPPLRVEPVRCEGTLRLLVQSTASLGAASLTMLDHHGDAASEPEELVVNPEGVVFLLEESGPQSDRGLGDDPTTSRGLYEGLELRVRDLGASGLGAGPFHLRTGPSVYHTSTGAKEDGKTRVRRPYADFKHARFTGGMPTMSAERR